MNRVNRINEGASTALLNVNYSIDGRRKNIVRTGGATTTYGLTNNNYALDNGLHLKTFTQDFTGTANDLTTTFTFTASNQIETLTQTNSLYYYQGNDNRVGAYVSNGLNQYTHIATQPLDYDGQANLTNDGTQTYTYDAENRLLTTSGTTASSFIYDPNGRLFQSTIGGTVTQYVYDGDALIGEYNSSGTLQRRYVHGDQVDEPLVQYSSTAIGASNRRYLHTDHQGSIIAHSDSSGSVFTANGTLAYDAYGIAATKNNSVVGAFGYTGQVYFPSLGLNYYKARFYHPKLGRFLQTDPIGYKDDYNLYAYVGNDPLNKTDPTGEQTCDPSNCSPVTAPPPEPTEIVVTGTKLNPTRDKPPVFLTIEAAGTAAVRNINPMSIKAGAEYAGRIYKKKNGLYSYTKPRKGNKDTSNHGRSPLFTKTVGAYHTHGADDPGYDNESYSGTDLDNADNEGIPEFLGTPSGDIYQYTPQPGVSRGGVITNLGIGAN